MKFSILLLYPDYIASNFGQDTHWSWVEADTPNDAITEAQQSLAPSIQELLIDVVDMYPLLVIEGHATNLRP